MQKTRNSKSKTAETQHEPMSRAEAREAITRILTGETTTAYMTDGYGRRRVLDKGQKLDAATLATIEFDLLDFIPVHVEAWLKTMEIADLYHDQKSLPDNYRPGSETRRSRKAG